MPQRKSPKTLEAEEKKRQVALDAQLAESQSMARAFATPDGRKALRTIMLRCCYQSQITASTPGVGVDTNAMIHNGALQKHYLWLRQYVDRDTLVAVEIDGVLLEKTGKE